MPAHALLMSYILDYSQLIRLLAEACPPYCKRQLLKEALFIDKHNHTFKRTQLDNEAGGETSKPATGPTGATTEGLGAHAAPGSAASGMARRVSGWWCKQNRATAKRVSG